MAVAQLRPRKGVIHHSDQGSHYTSLKFGKRCREAGTVLSMGSVGDCFDNTMPESLFTSLECELIDPTTFCNPAEAKADIFRYIEGWHNPRPRHSAIGHRSPVQLRKNVPRGRLIP